MGGGFSFGFGAPSSRVPVNILGISLFVSESQPSDARQF